MATELFRTTSRAVPGALGSLAVGDFNGDGKLDVAAVGINTSVSIFLGHGDGTFASPVQYPTGPMLNSPPSHNVLTGDFKGDGKLDLAVATHNGIAVLLGCGDGTFQPFNLVPSLSSASPGDELLALTDFNHDGKLDIVKATQTGTSIINVALGNGDGTFQQATGFPAILDTQASVPHEIFDKVYLARLPTFLFHLLDAAKGPKSGMASFLRVHALPYEFVDLVLQMKLKFVAEIKLSFVSAEKRAQAEWKFVVPTHGAGP